MKDSLDVYIVMEIGAIVSDLYNNKEIPSDTPYDDIVDFVTEELSKGDFSEYRKKEMDNNGDLSSTIEKWFLPRIIEMTNYNSDTDISVKKSKIGENTTEKANINKKRVYYEKVDGIWCSRKYPDRL